MSSGVRGVGVDPTVWDIIFVRVRVEHQAGSLLTRQNVGVCVGVERHIDDPARIVVVVLIRKVTGNVVWVEAPAEYARVSQLFEAPGLSVLTPVLCASCRNPVVQLIHAVVQVPFGAAVVEFAVHRI